MASDNSFDIVSKVDMQEMNNAIQQAEKEIGNRFDFKGSKSSITLDQEELILISDSEFKLEAVIDILSTRMVKRGITLKNMEFGKIEPASAGTVRQKVKLKQGVDQENAKKINVLIRDSKLKVKSQVQGDQIRVTGKSKNDLQQIMQILNEANLALDLQYVNFR